MYVDVPVMVPDALSLFVTVFQPPNMPPPPSFLPWGSEEVT